MIIIYYYTYQLVEDILSSIIYSLLIPEINLDELEQDAQETVPTINIVDGEYNVCVLHGAPIFLFQQSLCSYLSVMKC